MTTDPSLIDVPSPPRSELPRKPLNPVDRPANDEIVEIARDTENRSPASWLPFLVAFILLAGVVYYFFSPYSATVG